jgi:hypothetical protein
MLSKVTQRTISDINFIISFKEIESLGDHGSHLQSGYVGGWDQEAHSSRIVQAKSLRDPISKIPKANRIGGIVKAVEYLLRKHEALSVNPSVIGKIALIISLVLRSSREEFKQDTKDIVKIIVKLVRKGI